MSSHSKDAYFVPTPTPWPFILTVGLVLMVIATRDFLVDGHWGMSMLPGLIVAVTIIVLWFRGVISESETGKYNNQVDATYRMSMAWFIFSEVMFFGAFFGALYYARMLSLSWLAGDGAGASTNYFLWPEFEYAWPSNGPAEWGGAFSAMKAFSLSGTSSENFWNSLPLINTLLLLTSGVTCTIAHHALKEEKRMMAGWWLMATVALGALFMVFQVTEYAHAYSDLNLTLESGVYGSTFFMLTGFHGAHVTLGAIMLFIIMLRCFKGHFTGERHFGFEGAAWYWHFVDVVWLGLFIFVYIL